MLERSNKLIHQQGVEVETPLLVPSFSSKGFSFSTKGESEVVPALKVSKEFLTESLLVSAYDIHHGYLPCEEDYTVTDLTILDSGGYETSGVYDLSAVTKYNTAIKEWCQDKFENVIRAFPSHKAAIIVSYDHGLHRLSLEDQIEGAAKMFSKFPNHLSDFLIKPETESQMFIKVEKVVSNIKLLARFSIIGVTEKELGNSILERMKNLAKIRRALDSVNIYSPIHVFGSLDPITSILYFFAGAEIFDGLTWLKFSYFSGPAIYQSNYGALDKDLGIHVKDTQVRVKSLVNNIYFLDKMKYTMKEFVISKNFNHFDNLGDGIGDILEKAYKTFKANLN